MSKWNTITRIRTASIKARERVNKRWKMARERQAKMELSALEEQKCCTATVMDKIGRITSVTTYEFDSSATARRKQKAIVRAMRAAYTTP